MTPDERELPPEDMNKINRILLATAIAFVVTLASQSMAQSQMSGPNGIAASPKVRAMLSEQAARGLSTAAIVTANNPNYRKTAVAASPRVQQMLSDNAKSGVASTEGAVAPLVGREADGIAASPKVRQQMANQPVQFQIAPLK